jgi:hypothetical protein
MPSLPECQNYGFAGTQKLTDRPMDPNDALRMIKRRAKAAGLSETVCCHTFRATGVTAYLKNGGTIEKAQQLANHESPKTTRLYDRTTDQITQDEVERIVIQQAAYNQPGRTTKRPRGQWCLNPPEIGAAHAGDPGDQRDVSPNHRPAGADAGDV